jgi:hypothetical protein
MNPVIRFLYPLIAFGGIFMIMFSPSIQGRLSTRCPVNEVANPIVNIDDAAMFNKGLLIRYQAAKGFYSFGFEFKDNGDYKVEFLAPGNTSLTRSRYLPRDFDHTHSPQIPGILIVGENLPRHVRLQVTHKGVVETHDFFNDRSLLNY